jgi:hypothetical protein
MASVTTLAREIAVEERRAGIPSDRPLTDASIVRRRAQIAGLLLGCGGVALFATLAPYVGVQIAAVLLAGTFGLYAIRQDQHLHRLARLRGDSKRITLAVADELLGSGVIDDGELLDLRARVGHAAGSLAAGLADALPVDYVRVRLVGPSGELPIAALRARAPHAPPPDDRTAAQDALRLGQPTRRSSGERTMLDVPMHRGDDVIGVLEIVSASGIAFGPESTALLEAFARGAVAALRATN